MSARHESQSSAESSTDPGLYPNYDELFKQSKHADFSVIEKHAARFLYLNTTTDKDHNPVVVFDAQYFPPIEDKELLLLYIIKFMDPIVQSPYAAVYKSAHLTKAQRPGLAWIRRANHVLNRPYKKQLKQLYLIDAPGWVKVLVSLMKPWISSKFAKKLHYVSEAKLAPLYGVTIVPESPHLSFVRRRELVSCLPSISILPPGASVAQMHGPADPQALEHESVLAADDARGSVAAGLTVSTYPLLENSRNGHPIADRFAIECFENGYALLCCDGCGWGFQSSAAAVAASNGFLASLNKSIARRFQTPVVETSATHLTLASVADALLYAVIAADDAISALGAREEQGTTTLCGGLLLPLDRTDRTRPHKHVFVCVSVGDCKAFVFRTRERRVEDVTASNRPDIGNAHDPGGRLGPAIEHRDPDFRNLALYHTIVEDDDLVMITSDGVSDNLAPQMLGKVPSDVDLNATSWTGLEAKQAEFSTEQLCRLVQDAYSAEKLTSDERVPCKAVVDRIIRHCIETTRLTREYMQSHPQERQPEISPEFCGKFDHTTCIAAVVGTTASTTASSTTIPTPTAAKPTATPPRSLSDKSDDNDEELPDQATSASAVESPADGAPNQTDFLDIQL